MATSVPLTGATLSSPRHTTHYWDAGPTGGPLIVFLHGWPEIGLVWRAQMDAFASEGWHCIAPDMRGYGGSSAPATSDAYALKEIVEDMVALHDHLDHPQSIRRRDEPRVPRSHRDQPAFWPLVATRTQSRSGPDGAFLAQNEDAVIRQ